MNRFVLIVFFIGNISCAVQGLESSLKNLQVTLENLTNTLKPFASKDDEASKTITVFYAEKLGTKSGYEDFIDQIKSDLGEYSFDLKLLSDLKGSKDEEKAILLINYSSGRLGHMIRAEVFDELFRKVNQPIIVLYEYNDNPESTGVRRGQLAEVIADKLKEIKFKEIHLMLNKNFAAFRDSIKAFWFWIGSGSSPYGTVNKTAKADYDMQIDEIKKLLSEK